MKAKMSIVAIGTAIIQLSRIISKPFLLPSHLSRRTNNTTKIPQAGIPIPKNQYTLLSIIPNL